MTLFKVRDIELDTILEIRGGGERNKLKFPVFTHAMMRQLSVFIEDTA